MATGFGMLSVDFGDGHIRESIRLLRLRLWLGARLIRLGIWITGAKGKVEYET